MAKWCPIVWGAFLDYRINAHVFSGVEYNLIQEIITGNNQTAVKLAEESGLLSYGKKGIRRSREREEFEEKLTNLGLDIPWSSDASQGTGN